MNREQGTTILPAIFLLGWIIGVGFGVNHFFEINILISLLIGFVSFIAFIKIGDIISELSRDKQYDAQIAEIFKQSCEQCGSPLIKHGQVQSIEPPFKVHCSHCGHDYIINDRV